MPSFAHTRRTEWRWRYDAPPRLEGLRHPHWPVDCSWHHGGYMALTPLTARNLWQLAGLTALALCAFVGFVYAFHWTFA
jgi:hypothetical protein